MSYRRYTPVRYAQMPQQGLQGPEWSTTQKVLITLGAAAMGLLLYTNWQYVRQPEADHELQ